MANKPSEANFFPDVPQFPSIGTFQPVYGKFDLTTYIQGASDYEIMAFLVGKYNACIEAYGNIAKLSADTITACKQLQDWINSWFDNLDVQQELNNKIDSMVADGSFGTLLHQTFDAQINQQTTSAVTAWLVANVTPTGSAVIVDESLTISGAAADSKATGTRISVAENGVANETKNRKAEVEAERERAITRENEIEKLFTAPTQDAVNEWLNAHPEATTTVQNNSLSIDKMIVGTLGYLTPEMFGAVGDGIADDTDALNSFFLQNKDTDKKLFLANKYAISNTVTTYNGFYMADESRIVLKNNVNYAVIIGGSANFSDSDLDSAHGTDIKLNIDCNNFNCTAVSLQAVKGANIYVSVYNCAGTAFSDHYDESSLKGAINENLIRINARGSNEVGSVCCSLKIPDNHYLEINGKDFETGVELKSNAHFLIDKLQCWLSTKKLWENSTLIKGDATSTFARISSNFVTQDSMRYGIDSFQFTMTTLVYIYTINYGAIPIAIEAAQQPVVAVSRNNDHASALNVTHYYSVTGTLPAFNGQVVFRSVMVNGENAQQYYSDANDVPMGSYASLSADSRNVPSTGTEYNIFSFASNRRVLQIALSNTHNYYMRDKGDWSTAVWSAWKELGKTPESQPQKIGANIFISTGSIAGKYLASNGEELNNEQWAISDYFEVTAGLNYLAEVTLLGVSPSMCYYDESKAFLTGTAYNSKLKVTSVAPDNAKYIRISFENANSNETKLTPCVIY